MFYDLKTSIDSQQQVKRRAGRQGWSRRCFVRRCRVSYPMPRARLRTCRPSKLPFFMTTTTSCARGQGVVAGHRGCPQSLLTATRYKMPVTYYVCVLTPRDGTHARSALGDLGRSSKVARRGELIPYDSVETLRDLRLLRDGGWSGLVGEPSSPSPVIVLRSREEYLRRSHRDSI